MTHSPHPGMCQNTLDLGKAISFAFFIELFPTARQRHQLCPSSASHAGSGQGCADRAEGREMATEHVPLH